MTNAELIADLAAFKKRTYSGATGMAFAYSDLLNIADRLATALEGATKALEEIAKGKLREEITATYMQFADWEFAYSVHVQTARAATTIQPEGQPHDRQSLP